MKQIFSYLDYRDYLHDFYQEKKSSSGFSYRAFAQICGFASPIFLKLVIDRKTNLSKPAARTIAAGIGLDKSERDYFKKLVAFNQEKSIDRKLHLLDDLRKLTSNLSLTAVSVDQAEYFTQWYHGAVREMVRMISAPDPTAALASSLRPRITTHQAAASIELLKRLGMIRDSERGGLDVTDSFLTSGRAAPADIVRNYQRQLILLASESLAVTPPDQREISGATVSASSASFERIREEINRCRRSILEIAADDPHPDRVVRVNLHAFPLSDAIGPDPLIHESAIHGGKR